MRNNTYRKGLFFVLTIVLLLILSSIGSFGTSTYISDKKDVLEKTDSYLKGTITWITTTSSSVTIPTIPLEDNKLHALVNNFFINPNNIIVSNAKGDESYPSCIMEKNDGLVAYEYNVNSETHIYIRNTGDFGQNWSQATKIVANHGNNQDIEMNSPDLGLVPIVNKAYGVFKSPLINSGVIGFFEIDNILDLNNIKTYTYDFNGVLDENDPNITYDFWDFKTPKIVINKDKDLMPWFIVFIGTTNCTYEGYQHPCNNTLFFLFTFKQNPEQGIALGWNSDIQNLSNLSLSKNFDSSTRTFYGVCEINNDSNQDLFFFKENIKSRDYGRNLIYQYLTSSENLTHPQIFKEENHIYIIADSDSGTVLYKSFDDGETWDINQVTRDIIPTDADPNYPMLYANETHIFCSFIESGNIYLTKSIDFGLTWNNPVQLNTEDGSVVEEYQFGNFPDKHHILWADYREGNRDIYLNLLNFQSPSAPAIEGPTEGKKGVYYNFTFNSLDPDGDDVFYYINWGDGCTEDWVGPYPSGADFEFAHSFPFDNTFTIEVKAKDTSDFESDWSEFNINIPRNKALFYLLCEWFLEQFPLLERLLSFVR